jgi:hypothetical protein
LYVRETDVKVQFTQADAWATVAWLYGVAQEGTNVGFRYRRKGETEWKNAPKATVLAGSFKTQISGLEELTSYEFVAYSNEDLSAVVELTTERALPLENGGFELWCKKNNIVYPYADGGDPYWGTGNVGASIVNETLTEGVADVRPGSSGEFSARLSSKFASVFGIGKFAAGNLFVGKYVSTVGTNGIVGFGRKFTSRPLALRLWVKYNCGAIDKIGTLPMGSELKMGDKDTGSIFIALGTWTKEKYGVDASGEIKGTDDSPLIVDTRDKGTFFNPKSEAVVAYGELMLNESITEWQEVVIPLEYTTTSVVPTHITIVCSASRLGDYFTGSTQSVMWLDDMELLYE